MRYRGIVVSLSLGAAVSAPALAESLLALSTECEVAIARSAAPARLRESASVYVLKDRRYEKALDREGPLTCIVERNHRESLIPQCFDRGGIDSVLPAIIARGEMAAAGMSAEEIEVASRGKLEDGEFKPLPGAGISYMMSAYNYIYVPSAERVLTVPPHVMFYAPGVTNDDIGGSFESMVRNIGTPFVFSPGPHGYMVDYTEHPANADEVAERCRGQLGEAPPRFDPVHEHQDGTP